MFSCLFQKQRKDHQYAMTSTKSHQLEERFHQKKFCKMKNVVSFLTIAAVILLFL